jgi:hypothetical protein
LTVKTVRADYPDSWPHANIYILADLHIGDPIFHDKDLSKVDSIRKLQQDTYHIMQAMAGVHPGDPTYNTDQDPANYRKTMG